LNCLKNAKNAELLRAKSKFKILTSNSSNKTITTMNKIRNTTKVMINIRNNKAIKKRKMSILKIKMRYNRITINKPLITKLSIKIISIKMIKILKLIYKKKMKKLIKGEKIRNSLSRNRNMK
jgi:hypothetical protein